MENEANLNQSDPKHPAPSQDAGLAIETVTPDTEKETPDTDLQQRQETMETLDPKEKNRQEKEGSEPAEKPHADKESAPEEEQEPKASEEEETLATEAPETHTDDHGIETIAP